MLNGDYLGQSTCADQENHGCGYCGPSLDNDVAGVAANRSIPRCDQEKLAPRRLQVPNPWTALPQYGTRAESRTTYDASSLLSSICLNSSPRKRNFRPNKPPSFESAVAKKIWR
jgi:hypothetical protein